VCGPAAKGALDSNSSSNLEGGDRHSVSKNASKSEPAELLAVFVVDTDEKELTTRYEK
jgi:hypothetical protein